MPVSRVDGAQIANSEMDRMRFATGILQDAATTVGSTNRPTFLQMTPTATRIVTLPAVTAADNGKFYIIRNGAASGSGFDLTINNAAASTIGTISPLEAGLVIVVNGAWVVCLVGLNT